MGQHKVALVGLGMAVLPHAKSLRDLKDRLEVVHAFAPSEARRKKFAESFPFPQTDSLDKVLGDKSVDAVLLLTPPNTHLELVQKCAQAGKHVLLEKPLDITTQRAEALVQACKKANVTLGIVLQHRFRPAGEELKKLLDAGKLGKIVGVATQIYNWRPQSYYDQPGRGTKARDGGGVLLTQGIHTLDLMISLTGLPDEVTAYATTTSVHRMETEDLVAGAMRYANGALGTIGATTAFYPGFPERIEIIGETGTAVLEGTSLLVQLHDGEVVISGDKATGGGAGANPMDFPHDWHMALIGDFLDAIEERRPARISGEEGLKVHRLIDALLASAEQGRPAKVRQ